MAKTYAFPQVEQPHLVTIRDKTRNSGLTSVCFVDEKTLLACDFNDKTMYLVGLDGDELQIRQSLPTQVSSGEPAQTDLMDFDGERIVVSNFYQGSISLYRMTDRHIVFEEEINHNDYKGLHGVRFVPGYPDLLWLTYCGPKNKCFQIFDLASRRVVHEINTEQQCQDVAFIDNFAVVFARSNHILKGTTAAKLFSKKWWMKATAYVYRMPDDLSATAPTFVSEWHGRGQIDACKGSNGRIYAANQYLDRVDVFSISAQGKLKLSKKIKHMAMPHGVDIRNGKVAVTNYGDQTLKIVDAVT